jgi:hypothetical protein
MNFLLVRGKDFQEFFDFKNSQGRLIPLPAGKFSVVLERAGFAREYTPGNGLSLQRNRIVWGIKAEEAEDFEFATMYYTLYLNNQEITRGILRVQ